MPKYLIPAFLLIFCACQRPQKRGQNNAYYSLDSLLNQQLTLLKKSEPSLDKTATINGKTENATLSSGEVDWEAELSPFRQMDINQNAFKGIFQVTKSKTKTRYKILPEYASKNSFPVKMVEVTRYPGGLTKSVSGQVSKDSEFIHLRSSYALIFNQKGELTSYQIQQTQKLPLEDSIKLEISGKVMH